MGDMRYARGAEHLGHGGVELLRKSRMNRHPRIVEGLTLNTQLAPPEQDESCLGVDTTPGQDSTKKPAARLTFQLPYLSCP